MFKHHTKSKVSRKSLISSATEGSVYSLYDTNASNYDPFFSSNVLLLKGDGTNGQTNATFIDDSGLNKTVTRNGDVTQGTFSPFPVDPMYGHDVAKNGGSAYFDGTGDYLTLDGSADFAFGTGDFTIEMWVNSSATNANACLFDCRASAGQGATPLINLNTSAYLSYFANGAYQITTTTTLTAGTWYHIAVTRSAGVTKLFLNGTQLGSSYTDSTTYINNTGRPWIGADASAANGTNPFNGYISNLNVVKGTAKYTSNFTVPTAPVTAHANTKLLLNFTNAGIKDDTGKNDISLSGNTQLSTSEKKVGSAAMYFDGTGDYLSCRAATAWEFGTADFTVECWVKPNTMSVGAQILGTNYNGSDDQSGSFQIHATTAGSVLWARGHVTVAYAASAMTSTSQWYHLAVSRNSSTTRIFVNGIQVASAADTNNYSAAHANFVIGGNGYLPANNSLNAYVDDFRVTKGVGRYTQNFSVPTVTAPARHTPFPAYTPEPYPFLNIPPSSIVSADYDPYFTNNVLLINGDGANNQTNAVFLDESGLNKTITRNGDVTQGTFSPFAVDTNIGYSAAVNGGSAYFDGTGDYLTLADSADWKFGTGDWTVEFWVKPNELLSSCTLVTFGYNNTSTTHSWVIYKAAALLRIAQSTDGNSGANNHDTSTSLNLTTEWQHVAVVRNGSSVTAYLNGTAGASVQAYTPYAGTSLLSIGANTDGNSIFAGYLSNLNVIKGTAKYTSNFTAPTAPVTAHANTKLLLNFTNAGVKDGTGKHRLALVADTKLSTSQKKFRSASIYFDGTGDWITCDGSNDFAFGTGDWTIEMWVYKTANGLAGGLMSSSADATLTGQFAWYINSGTPTLYFTYGGSTVGYTNSVPTAQWVHLAVCKSGTYIRQFINGVMDGNPATNDSTNFTVDANRVIIGATDSGTNPFAGYIDDVRITKGVGRYTSNFTVPTKALPLNYTPLPAGPNTDDYWSAVSTLLKGDGTDNGTTFTDSTGRHTWTPTGNAATKTGVKKFGTAAMYFDGTGDYITAPSSSLFAFGTGDFTIELWVYLTRAPIAILCDLQNGANPGPSLIIDGSYKACFYKTSTYDIVGTSTLSLNTWYHVAASRSAGVTKLFVNGVQEGSNYTDSNNYGVSNGTVIVGTGSGANISYTLQGYIDNFRVTKGFARYTANFTPAWYEFPTTQTPTSASDPYWSNVVSLLHFDYRADGLIVDHKTGMSIAKYGNAGLSNGQSKYNGYSCYFDGTSASYLELGNVSGHAFGTGDFTIEMWVYRLTSTTIHMLYDARPAGTNSANYLEFYIQANGTVLVYTSAAIATGVTVLPTNAWVHLALCRTAGVSKVYINGVLDCYGNDSGNYIVGNTNGVRVGKDNWPSSSYMHGYIDDFRVTKGVARYTSNFVPPTQAHYDIGLPAIDYNAYWDETKLLLQGDYVGGSTSIFQDNSKYGRNPAPVNGAIISNAQAKWGTHSLYFDGVNDHLTLDNADFAFGTGDFTIEFWAYSSLGVTNGEVLSVGTGEGTTTWRMNINNDGTFGFYHNSTALAVCAAGVFKANTWAHIAVTRVGGSSIKVFYDGVQVASGTTANNLTATALYIGKGFSVYYVGYIDDLRLTKGVARYTQNFIPPQAAFTNQNTYTSDASWSNTSLLIHADAANNANNAIIVDNGLFGKTITRGGDVAQGTKSPYPIATGVEYSTTNNIGSAYFDGTGDYLTLDGSVDFAFGTGDFTIEFWANRSVAGVLQDFYDSRPTSTQGAYLTVYVTAANVLGITVSSAERITGTNALSANTWYHIAIVRSAGTLKLYRNGLQEGSSWTDSTNYLNGASRPVIGADGFSLSNGLTGYISNLHIVKGQAKYTSNFSVPTVPVTTLPSLADDVVSDYQLVLQGEGTNNQTNATFLDSSSLNKTVTRNGDATQGSANPFGINGTIGSAYFDGTGDYLTLDGSSDFTFGTGNFTIELWVRIAATGVSAYLVDFRPAGGNSTSPIVLINTSNQVCYQINGGNQITGTTALATSTWYHIALVRNSGSSKLYINGTQEGSTYTDSTNCTVGANRPLIGADGNSPASGLFTGFISNLHIVKGQAKYTANFTTPTAPAEAITLADNVLADYQLVLQGEGSNNQTNAVFVDSSTANHTVTRAGDATQGTFNPFGIDSTVGSAYFDGTGDYLTLDGSADFTFTGDFTIEMWVYPTTVGSTMMIWDHRFGSTSDNLVLYHQANSGIRFYKNADLITGGAITVNTWSHIAVCKSGTSTKLFINGTQSGSTYTDNNTYNANSGPRLGADQSGSQTFQGYISNLNIINGTAKYTANFTTPASPATADANTKLLLNFNNGGIVDSTKKHNVTLRGDAKVSTSQFKYGSSSIYFDGSGDWARIDRYDEVFNLSTGDFTVELWVYPVNAPQYGLLFGRYYDDLCWGIRYDGGSLVGRWTTNGSNDSAIGAARSTGQWYHCAFTREGDTLRFFIDGVMVQSTTVSGALYNGTGTLYGPAMGAGDGIDNFVHCYLDDIRLIKGVCRYNDNFTPAQLGSLARSRTKLLLNFNNGGIVDSTKRHNLQLFGDTKVSTSQFKYGSSSMYFDGTGDYVKPDVSSDWAFGTGDFTIEAWVYMTSYAGASAARYLWHTAASNQYLGFYQSTGNIFTSFGSDSGISIPINQWVHIAWSRISSVSRIFKDGIQVISAADATNYTATTAFIGNDWNSTGAFMGYIDDFRVLKGTGRYDSSFTPAQMGQLIRNRSKLLLNFTNSAVRDETGKHNIAVIGDTKTMVSVNKYGGSSLYFDGTGDYLQLDGSSDFTYGTGDFTIECWIYTTSATEQAIICHGDISTGNYLYVYLTTGGPYLQMYANASGIGGAGPTVVTANTWHHVAVSRSGTTIRSFLDGVLQVSTTNSTNFAVAPGYPIIGRNNGGTQQFIGYIDDYRITKGVSRYTGNFVPPTQAFLNK